MMTSEKVYVNAIFGYDLNIYCEIDLIARHSATDVFAWILSHSSNDEMFT